MTQSSDLNWQRDDFANITKPFENDLLNRKPLAEHLTRYIDRLQVGAVLALGARWGEGKTWFVQHWKAYLEQTDLPHNVIYLNAFAQDYLEDPFMVLSAEITHAFDNAQGDYPLIQNFKETAITAAKVLLPELPKLMLSLGVTLMGAGYFGKVLENTVGHVKNAVESAKDMYGEDTFSDIRETVDENIQDAIKERFEKHEADKQTLESFKQALRELAANKELNPKPLVFIIDELDRCNPLFSVHMIERIKHFFDIPNIVFVLVTDKAQLQKTICHQFGYDEGLGEAYLDKFIDFSIQLEKSKTSIDEYLTIITTTMKNLGFTELEIDEIKSDIIVFASVFNTSIRQLKKKLNQFTLIKTDNNQLNRFLLFKLFNKHVDSSIPLFYHLLDTYLKYIGASPQDHEPHNITDNIRKRLFKISVKDVIPSEEQSDITNELHRFLVYSSSSIHFILNIISNVSRKFEQSLITPDYPGFNQVVLDYCNQHSPSKLNTILEMNDAWDEYIKTGLNE